jgi:protein-L-isoaspartate O-methyltransferase
MNYLTATYSPEDNKLRLYSTSRLDSELYARVRAAGFIWAPKQDLFVAPMWTPSREDLLIELCGEIGDEDTSLVDRAEQRADRFADYSDNRAADAERAREYVSSIADNIPFGQPILVGHHSERHARRDAERIESGMRRAVQMWETSKYWTDRAAGAIAHAKYKELPAVRARRIKKIEAERRKTERSRATAEKHFAMWTKEGLTLEEAVFISGRTEAGYLRLPRKEGDAPDHEHRPSAHDALTNSYPNLYAPRTLEEVIAAARYAYPRTIAHCDRWMNHYENRLAYEKAMLDEQGASDLLKPKARPAQLPICNYRQESFQIENIYHRGEFSTYRQVEMTQAAYKAISEDRRGTKTIEGSHRVRVTVDMTAPGPHYARPWVVVFLTDSKTHMKPEAVTKPEPTLPEPRAARPAYVEPTRTEFDDMKDSLKAGVKVVSANQLFPTPPEIARQMVEAAEIEPGHLVLEPSVGTGNIVREIIASVDTEIVGYEINSQLVAQANTQFPSYRLQTRCRDFLEVTEGQGQFDRIVMNPPFENGADIKHIQHALTFLKPGGKLVALCANGPRQHEQLKPFADDWQPLPAGSFKQAHTGVNVAMLIITVPEAETEASQPDAEQITQPFRIESGAMVTLSFEQQSLF